jgi:hypothetical protein
MILPDATKSLPPPGNVSQPFDDLAAQPYLARLQNSTVKCSLTSVL